MSDIQFDEDLNYGSNRMGTPISPSAQRWSEPEKKGLKGLLMSWGLFKGEKQVNYFMIAIVIVCLFATAILMLSFFDIKLWGNTPPPVFEGEYPTSE